MSRHVTYRGTMIDMESLRRENEKVPALGNMRVNARGDLINRGEIVKTADEIARENHRVKTAIINTGLKGRSPSAPENMIEPIKKNSASATGKPATKPAPKKVERELPSGDIVIEDNNNLQI